MSAARTETQDAESSDKEKGAQRSYEERLQAFVGQPSGDKMVAPDPVNQAMIRHWVEAMGDFNPVYVDEDAARAAGFPGIVAPPTMLQAWIMRGLRASLEADAARAAGTVPANSPSEQLMHLLEEGGFTSVVATNCSQHYERPLVIGDRLELTSVIESISAEKQTALGTGHFLTTRLEYTDQDAELVATMRFRILKFRPKRAAGTGETVAERPKRPRPALTQDNEFFFEGAKRHELLIQRCTSCGVLRHPPRPACANCRSFEWDTVVASGRGTVYSYVVNHYPEVPAFDYPLVVALIELEEGTRLIANVAGIEPEEMAIGMPVQVTFVAFDDELTLPVFTKGEGTVR